MQELYEDMKRRVEDILEKGYVGDEYRTKAFSRWGKDFTSIDHPSVVEVTQ